MHDGSLQEYREDRSKYRTSARQVYLPDLQRSQSGRKSPNKQLFLQPNASCLVLRLQCPESDPNRTLIADC